VRDRPKVTVASLARMKQQGTKITMLTAYDCPLAKFIDMAGVDIVLVSDAVGTVGLGRAEAVSVSVDEMIYHTLACRNGVRSALLVASMPFGAYATPAEACNNALRLVKEGKADAIHLEGTVHDAGAVQAVVQSGVPVMAHIGIIKQKIVRSGAVRVQGRTASEAIELVNDALAMTSVGAFALVLECIPAALAEAITLSLPIPTIGVGAGPVCDGQFLVTQDMLGLYKEMSPRFLKVYLDLEELIVTALSEFRRDVEGRRFPAPEHSYSMSEEELARVSAALLEQR
jgi:3-methyl-2-oxobutanoate hydroxymethyltransferase